MKDVFYTDVFDAKSKAMKWVYYDKPLQKLYIEWNNSNLSAYDDVTQEMYENFRDAPSKGTFYNRVVYKSAAWPPGDSNVILKPAQIIDSQKVDRAVYEVTLAVESDSIADAVAYFANEHVVAVRRV